MLKWDDDTLQRLERLWRYEGLSASAIAKQLDPSGETSRSKILGKLNRLGLMGCNGDGGIPRPKPERAPKERSPAPERRPAVEVALMPAGRERHGGPKKPPVSLPRIVDTQTLVEATRLVAPEVIATRPVNIFQLREGHCRFPLGARQQLAEFYCGEPKVPGKAYCLDHCRLAYEPVKKNAPRSKTDFRPGGSKRTIPLVVGAEPARHGDDR